MSSAFLRPEAVLVAALALAAGLACERETRRFRELAPTATPPGPQQAALAGAYEDNAYAVAEGKRLFSQFNCVGCHAHGGGAMGPPLMDEEWIYGSRPEHIFATIVQGRPNGMPAFGGRIATHQVWQLVAYVRSMSGLLRKDVAPGREDALYGSPQEQAATERRPVRSGTPPEAERP